MTDKQILIIDDEPQICRFLSIALQTQGYQVILAETGKEGLQKAASHQPDMLLLDLGLPDQSGLQVLENLRGWSQVPVIILSVQNQEREKVKALDLGADDYLTKPFGVQELLARIRVALRHTEVRQKNSPIFESGILCVDLHLRRVWSQGEEIKLTKTEFALLSLFIQHAGKVLTHHQILRKIWGDAYVNDGHYLQIYVSRLRRKLEDDPTQPRLILTESGVGYRLAY